MNHTDYVIFYQNDEDKPIAVFSNPACGLTLEQVALKDVPKGKPFKFVLRSQIPEAYWIFQSAFVIDYSEPDGYGADYGVGSDIKVVGVSNGEVVLSTTEGANNQPSVSVTGSM